MITPKSSQSTYEDRKTLASRFVRRRKMLKLTQVDVAKAANVGVGLIFALGQCFPEKEHGSEWAVENALGVPRGWLRMKPEFEDTKPPHG